MSTHKVLRIKRDYDEDRVCLKYVYVPSFNHPSLTWSTSWNLKDMIQLLIHDLVCQHRFVVGVSAWWTMRRWPISCDVPTRWPWLCCPLSTMEHLDGTANIVSCFISMGSWDGWWEIVFLTEGATDRCVSELRNTRLSAPITTTCRIPSRVYHKLCMFRPWPVGRARPWWMVMLLSSSSKSVRMTL